MDQDNYNKARDIIFSSAGMFESYIITVKTYPLEPFWVAVKEDEVVGFKEMLDAMQIKYQIVSTMMS